MKIVALAGGVGGARLAHGFSKLLSPEEFSVIVNTADDFFHFGLYIAPDLDTVCYTLAEQVNQFTGYGREEDTFHVLDTLSILGGPVWFKLGDRDIALHLERTRRLNSGSSLTNVSLDLEKVMGISHKIFPMSDEKVSTQVETVEFGKIPFQEYFAEKKYQPKVRGFQFRGIFSAAPTKDVIEALERATAVVVCPSNPFVSINPILSLRGIKDILQRKYVVAVSPLIKGKAVKGPLAKMLGELGYEINNFSIAKIYSDFLNCFFIDTDDYPPETGNTLSSIIIKKADIFIPDIESRTKLAEKIINHLGEISL
jgi:LPPG:FO 2-phospho-L-lactate transferase